MKTNKTQTLFSIINSSRIGWFSSKKMIQALLIPALIFAGVLIDPASSVAASGLDNTDTNITAHGQPPISNFSVRVAEGRAFLNWYVEGATEESIYLILRSSDGLNFTNVGDRKGVASPRDLRILNCFIDTSPVPGTSYYQLVRINSDLSTSLSGVVNLNNNEWQIAGVTSAR